MRLGIIIFFSIYFIVSCANDTSTEVNSSAETGISPIVPEISINASRNYNPSKWYDFNKIVESNFESIVPNEIHVITGNSGTGWVSLIIGSRKFCYQGNASNNQTLDGDKFILVIEKSNVDSQCSSSTDKINANRSVTIKQGDIISLSVNGGGCSNSAGTCVYTEVATEISSK